MISAGDVWTLYSVVSDQVTSLSPTLIFMVTAAVVDPGGRAIPQPCCMVDEEHVILLYQGD